MEVILVKEVISCDVSPVVMFTTIAQYHSFFTTIAQDNQQHIGASLDALTPFLTFPNREQWGLDEK